MIAHRAQSVRSEIQEIAAANGLSVASVTSAAPFDGLGELLDERVAAGNLAGMDWFTPERSIISETPTMLHDTCKAIIAVGIPYYRSDIAPPNDTFKRGKIARYAWGVDYHKTLKRRMQGLKGALEEAFGQAINARLLVDTARIVDRAVAARSGLGWYGKHSNIIVPGHSSFVMLGEMLVDIEIEPDAPIEKNCGSCRICLNRCPTGAIVEPYRVHAPLCISFQTIEQRGHIPVDLRSRVGNWVFGCDVCQDVCPYTGAAREMIDEAFEPASIDNAFPSLSWLLSMTEQEFRSVYRGTAVLRTKRSGLARNAAVALGNIGDRSDVAVLVTALSAHDEALVRAHAAWALGRIGGDAARSALSVTSRQDTDEMVRGHCMVALEESNGAA